MQVSANEPLRVIFIAGYGRSGSTILDRYMGSNGLGVSLGEFRHVWHRGFVLNQNCSCGSPFDACEFWQNVIRRARTCGEIDADRMIRIQRQSSSFLTNLELPKSGHTNADLEYYLRTWVSVYKAIAEITGQRTLIDSSKSIPAGLCLSRISGLDVHYVHLVRDSRAVAYSWQKRKPDGRRFLKKQNVVTTSKHWVMTNLKALALQYRGKSYARVRFEDFLNYPNEITKCLGDGIGICKNEFAAGRVEHLVSGNPTRFDKKAINPKVCAWKEDLGTLRSILVTLLTFPLLHKFGYSIMREEPANVAGNVFWRQK